MTRCRLAGERGTERLKVCVLSNPDIVFSTKVAEVGVPFPEKCLYFDATRGYLQYYAGREAGFEYRRLWRKSMGIDADDGL